MHPLVTRLQWPYVLLVAMLSTSTAAFPGGIPVENVPGSKTVSPASSPRSLPLDFAYRVQGSVPAIGMVFDDGTDVFMQPLHPLQASELHVGNVPHVVQGPYLVVRGLANRIEVSAGLSSASTVIEYRGAARQETVVRDCVLTAGEERRESIPFGTGALQTEPGGFHHLARVIAMARLADRVTIVSQGDRPNSPIALKRAAHVRELLVAAGVSRTAITMHVSPPAASTVHVVAARKGAGCPPAGVSSMPAPVAQSAAPLRDDGPPAPASGGEHGAIERIPTSADGHEGTLIPPATVTPPRDEGLGSLSASMPSAVDLSMAAASGSASSATALHMPPGGSSGMRLRFHPNSSVQATLRNYLQAHGLAVEFRQVPLLMVEEFAEVSGADVREVLRRALSRLGLRGEIQGNRLLVVELAR